MPKKSLNLPEQEPIPPEPARSGGFVGDWVMSKAQYEQLPETVRRRWVWSVQQTKSGPTAFGKPRQHPD